ncbi:hypothetical protein LRN34_23835, partial [Enterobacter kobei]|uniref:hypothetical protein n=1 Tax=Enterobacter kobei TaxID=208224 RepID=UPI001E40824A
LSSTYRKPFRDGIYTPDENLIDTSTVDVKKFGEAVIVGEHMHDCTISVTFDDKVIADKEYVNRYIEDGLVLCFANRRSNFIAKKLKKEYCVKIKNAHILKDIIDEQVGVKGLAGNCSYTQTHERNHFLKSFDDIWQNEYRIFWNGVTQKEFDIELPPNIAELVPIRGQLF